MKVVAHPIEMIAWFKVDGTPNPVRFKYNGDVVKIDKISDKVLNKWAGNNTMVYTCRSVINGVEKVFEVRYEINTMKWILFKI